MRERGTPPHHAEKRGAGARATTAVTALQLASLQGLDGLKTVGGDVRIRGNQLLTMRTQSDLSVMASLQGFDGLRQLVAVCFFMIT